MTTSKNGLIYKRDKTKLEISGDPKEVKKAMWFDMITNKLFWIVLVLIFVIVVPKATLLPLLWAWLKKQLPLLIHFGVVGVSLLILSG